MRKNTFKGKMSKGLALVLTSCILLTGCGASDAGAASGKATWLEKATQAKNYKIYTEEEIEAKIKAAGEKYDGLYTYDDEYFMFNSRGAGSMNKSYTLSGDAVMESEACDEGGADYIAPQQPDVNWVEENWNTENYNNIVEHGFQAVSTSPFSTFGADVDTATYTNLRRRIFEGDEFGIDDSAIRVEEMINYFHYDYATPENGDKFGVTTALTNCPWNKDTLLLRVGVKAEEIQPQGGSNIVFLIDTSGSMFDSNKLPLAQKAFTLLTENLSEEDTISIVTYAGTDTVVIDGAKGNETDKIKQAINSLEAYGSTNGEGGILKAYEIAEKHFVKGGNNRIILATDGDLNVGASSESELIKLVEEKRETGVFLSCLGFGTGNYQDSKMEALADYGNGNYSYIDCTAEASRVLKDEMWSTLYTVAKDVKFQVEFNPALVKGYRQIGYENRAMAAEDFANDKKDGGEVGSGQTVTVLYEIVPADSSFELPTVTSRYGNTTDGTKTTEAGNDTTVHGSDELLAVNIRYKEPDASESKLLTYPVTQDMFEVEMDPDTSFAAGVAEFGMLLRKSEYSGTASYQEIYDRLKVLPGAMDDEFKTEFLYLVQTVSK